MRDMQPPAGESAQAIYDRIQRRRRIVVDVRPVVPVDPPGPGPAARAAEATRPADPVGARHAMPQTSASSAAGTDSPPPTVAASAGAPDLGQVHPDLGRVGPAPGHRSDPDSFPRSRTMRLALEHPEAVLAVAIPAAVLLAASPATRRLLSSIMRIAATAEARQLLRLTSLALTRGDTRPGR